MNPRTQTVCWPRGIRRAAFFLLAATCAAGSAIAAPPGQVDARDGDTLLIDGQPYDLAGIKAPPMGRDCRIKGHKRDCGRIARAALLDLVAGASVTCTPVSGGSAPTFRCLANGYDLSEGMLHFGWAIHLRNAPARYRRVMAAAREAKRGFWAAEGAPPVRADD